MKISLISLYLLAFIWFISRNAVFIASPSKYQALYKLSCPGWCFSRGNNYLVSMLFHELFYLIDDLLVTLPPKSMPLKS